MRAALALAAAAAAPVHAGGDANDVLLFSYFTTAQEALHLAYSFDGLNFTALNGNQPVLQGPAPYTSIRDPYIARSADGGSNFHLVATAGAFGTSDRIHHWTMTIGEKGVSFSADGLPQVMQNVSGTKECWAPEFAHDAASGKYIAFWSSETPQAPGGKRIWGSWTRDFVTFEQPQVLLDPGYTVIDATSVQLGNGSRFLFFKDERDETRGGQQLYKAVRRADAGALGGPYAHPSGLLSPHMTEGPEVAEFPNPTGKKYLLYYDCFTIPQERGVSASDDLAHFEEVGPCGGCDPSVCGVSFPAGARHGSFTRISRSELAALQRQYPH
eukprot:TRINITY_DN28565_c0_g1_i1.p1 TRINITY_DN28565_c0_g1~~TRINITY_DN28565_c0_g1_i1.p1  ORF type:complete len:356 (+),score=107.01 TRINITY_DN28565_c0_g1_i1:88-1068(+)